MIEINDLIGDFGKYHLWLCVLIFTNKFGIAFHQMAIIFLAPPVTYSCPHSNETCCDTPQYNRTIFKNTIVMEWHLICDKSWLKDFTQTIFMFGVLVGSLFLGMASDRFGRKVVLIGSVVCEVLFGVLASFMPDYWAFTIMRMFLGAAVGGIMVVGFVVIIEFSGNKYRDTLSALYQLPFTVGHMLLPLISYYFNDYRYYQLAISLSCSILLLYICLLPETPRWLLAMSKIDKSIQMIKTVAKINNLPTENIEEKIALYQKQQTLTTKKGTALDLFRTPNMRKNILIMSFQWLICSYCFYGLSQYISQLSGDMFMNVIINGALTTFGVIMSIPLMKLMGRKTVVIISNAACGVCLIMIACLKEGLVSVVLGCVGSLFSFVVFVVVYLYATELFPTTVRSAAMGICSMMARIGGMIAPFIAALGSYGYWCPPLGFGIPPLIAAMLCLLIPETKNCPLLTTIEEGEAFGKRVQPQTSPGSSQQEPTTTTTTS